MITLEEFKQHVDDSIRNADCKGCITPDVIANRFDELAELSVVQSDTPTITIIKLICATTILITLIISTAIYMREQ